MAEFKDMADPVRAALKEGYSQAEVLDFIGERYGLADKIGEARSSGYKDREIIGHLTGFKPLPHPRELLDDRMIPQGPALPGDIRLLPTSIGDAARSFALGTRDVIEGAAGIPVMIGDAANRFLGLQPVSGLLERGFDAAGFPRAETAQERMVSDINRAGAGVIAGGAVAKGVSAAMPASPVAARAADVMLMDPRAQMVAAGTGATASGVAREDGYPPLAQLGAGIVGSVAAPGTGMRSVTAATAERAAEAGTNMVRPFTKEGREVIVGNVLRRLARDPDAAAARMGTAPEYVPGSRPTAAQASRDTGLLSAQTPIQNIDDTGRFASQYSENALSRRAAIDRIARDEQTIARAEAKRDAVTGPIRERAFEEARQNNAAASAGRVEAAIDSVLASPAGKQEAVERAMNWVRDRLRGLPGTDGGIDPQNLYALRKDIGLAMGGRLSGEKQDLRLARGELMDVRRAIDEAIEAVAPGFRGYLSTYQRMSQPIDQMRLLQDIRQRSLGQIADATSGVDVLMPGKFKQAIRTLAPDIAETLTPSQRLVVDRIAADLDRSAAAYAPGMKPPGSDTFRNMSVSNLIGTMMARDIGDNATLKTLSKGLSFLYRVPDEQLQRLLVEAMLDPALARQFMQKATTSSVETVGSALRRKLEQTSVAAATSQSSAQ
jgi:hypothetical protein